MDAVDAGDLYALTIDGLFLGVVGGAGESGPP